MLCSQARVFIKVWVWKIENKKLRLSWPEQKLRSGADGFFLFTVAVILAELEIEVLFQKNVTLFADFHFYSFKVQHQV